ncbi:MAG: hypothetical protein R3B07_30710 [Polyangiaceae bacterium]
MATQNSKWITVFRNRLRADAGTDYGEVASSMRELAKSMPGYVRFQDLHRRRR